MAQRNSASAKETEGESPERADELQRRRAADYLDLWERQLTHAASQATPAELARKGAKAGA
jgi:hypothetical protein